MTIHNRKQKTLTLFSLCSLLAFSACTIDAYEKGEGEYSLTTAELVEAHVGSDKKVDYVMTDQGERLLMQPSVTAKWIETADTTYRALMYYNIVREGAAEAVSMGRVGVLIPRSLSSREGSSSAGSGEVKMKTDPLYLESSWLGKNRRYLNLRLRLLTGSTTDEDAVHTIGLVHDSLASTPTHARLKLYHDQGGQPEYYSVVTYASIPLYMLNADTLTLEVNTYDGMVERTFVCTPKTGE
jgi:hypothetical protein